MKEGFIVLVIVILIFSGIYVLVNAVSGDYQPQIQNSNFVFTGEVVKISGDYTLKVVEDLTTKNLYLLDSNYQRGGLCPWLDSDGKPKKGK